MDGRQFDGLAKMLAAQRHRRGMIRAIGAILGGSLAGVIGRRRPAAIAQSGETAAGFETCTGGACREPKTQLQISPYQVWCTASPKTNDSAGCTAAGCRCHLYWRKKPNGDWEHAADQNVKKNIQDTNDIYKSQYDYECRCQKAKADSSTTADDAAFALPDLTSAAVMPEGYALEVAAMVFEVASLINPELVREIFDRTAADFKVGFEATASHCTDDGPCDEVRMTAIAHTDADAASAKTEAVFYGLPANAANMTGAYLLDGVGQSQFTVTYPIEDESGPRNAVHIGFHVDELSGEVQWTGSSPSVDGAKAVAEEVIITFSKIKVATPVPDASSLMLRFQGEASNLVIPLVRNEIPVPLAGVAPDDRAIYNQELNGVLNGIRSRHELPGADGAPTLIVINTVLQMPDLETARSYLDNWPGSYQPVLDLQGIEGQVIDPPVLLGDEGYHSAFSFTLQMQDGSIVDGLNLAGLFQGPTSTWFASMSLRSTEARDQNLDEAAIEQLRADLAAIGGSGFISTYDSLVRATLNGATEYRHELLPAVPMPDLPHR